MPYSKINAHRSMALDHKRNAAYFQALEKVVSPSSIVLDLGAGVGICGLMAAKLGARMVYLVEPENVVHAVVPLAPHSTRDRIRIVQERAEQADIPGPIDIIVSVFTGNFLLAEDLLPSLFHVRNRYLGPAGQLIPDAARMMVAPVHAPKKHDEFVAAWSSLQCDIDLSAARPFAANSIYYIHDGFGDFEYLAQPGSMQSFDFYTIEQAACDASMTFVMEQSTLCHGLLGWFDMRLSGAWVSTGPEDPRMHWAVAYLPLDPPLSVMKNEIVSVQIVRPEHGDWSWRVSTHTGKRQHSTFFGSSLTPDSIHKADGSYQPKCTVDGRLIRHVLACFEQRMTVTEIQESTYATFGDCYNSRGSVERAVARLVARYG